jgi:hypothetical protein
MKEYGKFLYFKGLELSETAGKANNAFYNF